MSVAEWRSQSRRKENRVAATSNENVALGQVRQGDVLLIPVDKVPTESQYVYRIKGAGIILAAGEATGHHHRVRERGAREYRKGKERYLTTGKAAARSRTRSMSRSRCRRAVCSGSCSSVSTSR